MAVHIISHGIGRGVVHIGTVRYWAERGLIHAEDSVDNSYHTIPVKEMLLRIKAINDFRPGIDGTEDKITKKWVYEQRQKIQKQVEQMLEIVRKAQAQGMPGDPTASHALRAARPTTVVMPREKVLKDIKKTSKGKTVGIFDDFG